jgi:Asp-tRNA(Asn)/Glu-tRNA(Gln) amidotransferase A subunit family amidase
LRDPVVREPSGLRLAYTPAISSIPSSERQRAAIESFVTRLRDAGARIVEAPLPFAFDDILQAFRRTMQISLRAMAGATGAPPGLRDLAGDPVGVVELLAALDERDDWVRRFQAFLEPHDAWICPTTPDAAFSHRPRGQPIVIDGQSVSPQVIDHPCLLATYTGCPSLVVPIGLVTSPDLPIGVQLHAPRWHDDRLLDVGAAVSKIIGELPSPSLA